MTELETIQHRLQTRISQVCGHLNVLHAELVALTAESLSTQAWCGEGIISASQWVAWQTGLSPERAKQIVHIAQRSSELPVTFAAFSDGLLSIDQMAVVAKSAPALNDREACDLACNATVAQLRVGLSKHFFPPAPEPEPGDRPVVETSHRLSVGFNDTGEFTIHGTADSVDGAVIHNALREAKDALFQAGDTNPTWLDALLEICSRSIGTIL